MPLGFVASKWAPIPRVAGFEIHMSVSSISSPSAPLPYNYLDNTQPAAIVAAVVTPDNSNDNSDAGAVQPPAPAPLPPGQGTRIDQLV